MVDNDIGGVWRTVGGRRIFIKNGQDLSTAMRESGKFNEIIKANNQKYDEIRKKKEKEVDEIVKPIKLSEKEHLACNEVLEEFKKNNNENLSIIDINIFERKGDISTSNKHSSVGYSKEQEEIIKNASERSLIAIHNHPGNGTFSLQDIYTCIEDTKIGGIMVVTEDYIYSLKPDFSKSLLERDSKGYYSNFESKLGDANDRLLSKYPMYSNNQLYHMAFKEVFEEMGWEYGREERNKD